jgi:hypothetical protein
MNIKYSLETNQILCGLTDITEDSVAAVIQWMIANNTTLVIQNQTTKEAWAIVTQQLNEADKATLH